MQTRTYGDLFKITSALIGTGGQLDVTEQDQLSHFINRRFQQAFDESPVWPRYLVSSEARDIISLTISGLGAGSSTDSSSVVNGNYILLGQEILDSMESRFNNTDGCLSDKLMAAMQGAKVIGADTRCTTEGTSSLSAFLRVAKPTDHPDTLSIDLNIAGTPSGVEPIDKLQTKYNNWRRYY